MMLKGFRLLLARGLSQVRMLRLPTGRGRLHPLHKSQFDSLQKRLPQVYRRDLVLINSTLRLVD
jgi:hypothetical protein